ncbi:MAG: hypothetical protein H6579_03830 [Chitinophagales bacterium]|nr:hypothetical protein [Chitinophagales bacterium]
MRYKLLLTFTILFSFALSQSPYFEATQHAHSHNDYLKKKPLWDALKNGCTSIEVDVFAYKGSLKVAHVNVALNQRKSFEELYLLPLIEFLDQHAHLYTDTTQELVLMIDFKSSSSAALPLLLQSIENYTKYFSYYENGKLFPAPLQLVISGSGFSYKQVQDLEKIYVFLDGNVSSCNSEFPEQLVPRGSARYGSIFSWNGKKSMPVHEEELLKSMVQEASKCNKKLRFYAMPEKLAIWRKFLDEGVYWINVDHSAKFKKFYQAYLKEKRPN